MMLTLRGLPPDMEIPDIRSYILKRFAVERVLLDELTTEAGGTRRVTVVTISDADAATLRHALSGERIGAYTLLVEPCLDSPITSGSSGVLNGESGRNYGGLSGFRGHRGQLHERKSGSLGKHTMDDDDPIGKHSKIMRYNSEINAGLDSGIGVIYETRGNRSEGYSPPGGYNEPDKFSWLSGCNAIRQHSPCTNDNRRESGKVSPLEHAAQEFKVHQTTTVSYAAPGGQKLQVYSNTQSSEPAIPMNRKRDSGQRRLGKGPGLISGNVPLWLVEEMQIAAEGSRKRSLSPVSNSARGKKRRRSPSPTFRGNQPAPGNQQLMPPLKPPPTPQLTLAHMEIFNNAMATIKAHLAVAEPITPLNVLGTPRNTFPFNPLQRFNPPIQPMGTKPQCSKPIEHFEKSTTNSDHAKNNSLANTRPAGDQTFSQDAKYKNIKCQTIYSHQATTILNDMVKSAKVKPNYRSKAISFEHKMRDLICKRLRELTSEDPFHKDLVFIYRKAYPTSTDEETMKSVTEQLSLPEIPMALKDFDDIAIEPPFFAPGPIIMLDDPNDDLPLNDPLRNVPVHDPNQLTAGEWDSINNVRTRNISILTPPRSYQFVSMQADELSQQEAALQVFQLNMNTTARGVQCTPVINDSCSICLEHEATWTTYPCGHKCLCDCCIKPFVQSVMSTAQDIIIAKTCPQCRSVIGSFH